MISEVLSKQTRLENAMLKYAVVGIHFSDQVTLDAPPTVTDSRERFVVDRYAGSLHAGHSSGVATPQQRLTKGLRGGSNPGQHRLKQWRQTDNVGLAVVQDLPAL